MITAFRAVHASVRVYGAVSRVSPASSPALLRALHVSTPDSQRGPPGRPPMPPPQAPPKPMGILDSSGNVITSSPPTGRPAAARPGAPPAAARPPAGRPGAPAGAAGQTDQVIFEVDESNFQAVVLQSPVAVVLDCYADWCDPCKQLTPKLENIVRAIASRGPSPVRLVKLNVDLVPSVSGQLGVRTLPTVIGIVAGQMVDSFSGVVADEALKAFFNKVLGAAEQAGLVPGGNPIQQLGTAVAKCSTLIDNNDAAGALEALPTIIETLQKYHDQILRRLQAESDTKAMQEKRESTPVRTDIGPLADIDGISARAVAALGKLHPRLTCKCMWVPLFIRVFAVRAMLATAQASFAEGADGKTDVAGLYQQVKLYGDMLRTRFKSHLKDSEVARALSAADLAVGAEAGK
jgi:thiol-disulfide isomerase/thioredoxin